MIAILCKHNIIDSLQTPRITRSDDQGLLVNHSFSQIVETKKMIPPASSRPRPQTATPAVQDRG